MPSYRKALAPTPASAASYGPAYDGRESSDGAVGSGVNNLLLKGRTGNILLKDGSGVIKLKE